MIEELRGQLLSWYDKHQRILPWRALHKKDIDPYKVWLSEIMLQQTTVAAVKSYFLKFINLWPSVEALANAPEEDIMREWAGLGYYARARNLHKCAKIISQDYGGVFPQEQDALKQLPGIGEYTSAAVSAIAFNKPAAVVDGNIERVLTRLFAITDPLPGSKPLIKTYAKQLFDKDTWRPGDLAQALMDLGAGICTAGTAPKCTLCPISDFCTGYQQNIAQDLPKKEKKKKRPQKYGQVFWIEKNDSVLLQRRPPKGLLGGMVALPTSSWDVQKAKNTFALDNILKNKTTLKQKISHSFTHFDLELTVHIAQTDQRVNIETFFWEDGNQLSREYGFPTVFGKAVELLNTHRISC